jgi:hypothetical protein
VSVITIDYRLKACGNLGLGRTLIFFQELGGDWLFSSGISNDLHWFGGTIKTGKVLHPD